VWIIGGDGWAYDIGYGGLDHVLASGGQRERPRAGHRGVLQHRRAGVEGDPAGAVAKFASTGKEIGKKDLGALAMQYGNVYVAQIAMGANEVQTIRALLEAAAWPGPSLVLAYSTCIAHGFDMRNSMHQQRDAVKSGYWPLYRFSPTEEEQGKPFRLDSRKPAMPVAEFARARGGSRCWPAPTRSAPRADDARAGRRGRAVALLRAARRRGAHHPASDPVPIVTTRPGRPRRRSTSRRRRRRAAAGPVHHLPRAVAAVAAGRLLRSADRAASRRCASSTPPASARSCCRRCSRSRSSTTSCRPTRCSPSARAPTRRRPPTSPTSTSRYESLADRYLRHVEEAKAALDVPVIGSLNGVSPGGWTRYAHLIADAGADALELNLYRVAADPTCPAETSRPSSSRWSRGRRTIDIPLAVKVGPTTARSATWPDELVEAGADGLVLFNRFYQPDLDPYRRVAVPRWSCRPPPSCGCRCAGSGCWRGGSTRRWRSPPGCTPGWTPRRRCWPARTW
jgi:hypothetical protein